MRTPGRPKRSRIEQPTSTGMPQRWRMRGSLRAEVEDVFDHGMREHRRGPAVNYLMGRKCGKWGRGNHFIECETHRGFHTSLGRGDPCTAVRRRENLRSASFRDYAMGRADACTAGLSPAPNVKAALRCRARTLHPQGEEERCGLTAGWDFFCVILSAAKEPGSGILRFADSALE